MMHEDVFSIDSIGTIQSIGREGKAFCNVDEKWQRGTWHYGIQRDLIVLDRWDVARNYRWSYYD